MGLLEDELTEIQMNLDENSRAKSKGTEKTQQKSRSNSPSQIGSRSNLKVHDR